MGLFDIQRRYIAFDIETAKNLPPYLRGDLLSYRPLGITCAATWCSDQHSPDVFYSKREDGTPAPQMTREDLSTFIDHLTSKTQSGYTIVTHNGCGFDFDVLAEESGRLRDCQSLALAHVDMLFHFFCVKGFLISLDAAAKALGKSKSAQVDGALAPQLWQDGEHDAVLRYVAEDCRLTEEIAQAGEESKKIGWITRQGKLANCDLPGGWLTVEQASRLPLPDTSWMDRPLPRSRFTAWLGR